MRVPKRAPILQDWMQNFLYAVLSHLGRENKICLKNPRVLLTLGQILLIMCIPFKIILSVTPKNFDAINIYKRWFYKL